VTYAVGYGEQEIPYGSVRRRMALHPPTSSRAYRAWAPQASRPEGDPRRRFLRAKEWLPLAMLTEGLPAVEDRLRLVQKVALRRYLRTPECRAASAPTTPAWQRDPNPSAGVVDSQSVKTTGVGGTEQRGFDPAKKVDGRKRHILVDTEGLVVEALVHSARVPDQDGIRLRYWIRLASA
jgi:hypothetical protein